MTREEEQVNREAAFEPMAPRSDDPEKETKPCLIVGGVQVYAYFDEGVLQVSIHYDDAVPGVIVDDAVPTEISMNGTEVFAV